MHSEKNKLIEEVLLFASCRENSASDEEAFLDFELIQNMLAYRKIHILQPARTKSGYVSKLYRTITQQYSVMIDARINENNNTHFKPF